MRMEEGGSVSWDAADRYEKTVAIDSVLCLTPLVVLPVRLNFVTAFFLILIPSISPIALLSSQTRNSEHAL